MAIRERRQAKAKLDGLASAARQGEMLTPRDNLAKICT
jgi:hypothetical protein